VLQKNKPAFYLILQIFNIIIHYLSFREIIWREACILGLITKKNPTLEKLDRVLVTADWEALFPLVVVNKIVKH
jgi:hypothetical protein